MFRFGPNAQDTNNNDTDIIQLKSLAQKCNVVIEIGDIATKETIGLLDGCPGTMYAYANNPSFEKLKVTNPKTNYILDSNKLYSAATFENLNIPNCDLLFLSKSTKYNLLNKYYANVSKWIALKNPNYTLVSLKDFLGQHSEWFVIYHNITTTMTILSCLPADKSLPPIVPKTMNYKNAPNTCNICPFRRNNRCAVGGVYLNKLEQGDQIFWMSSVCPIANEMSSSSSAGRKCFV